MNVIKTPDEIKKGLEDGVPYHVHKGEACLGYIALAETLHKMSDALAYIQQLEAANTELLTKCERLERERDAAVNELIGTCSVCRWEETKKCGSCHFNSDAWNVCESNWEWRGVKEE